MEFTEAGKFYPPGLLHEVELVDLEPDTEYWYQTGLAFRVDPNLVGVNDLDGVVWSDRHHFRSDPIIVEPKDASHAYHTGHRLGSSVPYSYAIYGDQGCPTSGWGYFGGVSIAHMMRLESNAATSTTGYPIRSVHHIGDLAYAKGAAHVWDEWLRMLSPFSTLLPLMIGVGNHVRHLFTNSPTL